MDCRLRQPTVGAFMLRMLAAYATSTVQAAMRRSSSALTRNVYTDPGLLDVVGALEALREFCLDDRNRGS